VYFVNLDESASQCFNRVFNGNRYEKQPQPAACNNANRDAEGGGSGGMVDVVDGAQINRSRRSRSKSMSKAVDADIQNKPARESRSLSVGPRSRKQLRDRGDTGGNPIAQVSGRMIDLCTIYHPSNAGGLCY
jgi:hypothetical protein